jgi:ABC-2 type transport system ATP-binding protein
MSVVVNNVSKYFGKQAALNEVSFSVSTGEIIGFLGPNGAGKSTIMKIMTGYVPASSGEVRVCDIDVAAHTLELRRMIGYLPEHNPLYLDMYVREYLAMVGGIHKLKAIKDRVEEMIVTTGLEREAHKKIEALSKGYRQRVGLAQALIPDPEVLILDEPTTGLDPNQIVEVRELIKTIGKDKTIILSTHIMQEVEAICERVIILNKGQIVADQRAEHLSSMKTGTEQIIRAEFNKPVVPDQFLVLEGVTNATGIAPNKVQITNDGQKDLRPEVFRYAVANDLVLLELIQESKNLESVFQDLTR